MNFKPKRAKPREGRAPTRLVLAEGERRSGSRRAAADREIERRAADVGPVEDSPVDPGKVQWQGDIGLIGSAKRAGKVRYDLALRKNGALRVFYGVTEDGMEGQWSAFLNED